MTVGGCLFLAVPDKHRCGASRRQGDRQARRAARDGGRRQRQQAHLPPDTVPRSDQGARWQG